MAAMRKEDMEKLIIRFSRPAGFVPDASRGHAHYVSTLIEEERKNHSSIKEWRELNDAFRLASDTIEMVLEQHPTEAGRFQNTWGKISKAFECSGVVEMADANNRSLFYDLIGGLGSIVGIMRDTTSPMETKHPPSIQKRLKSLRSRLEDKYLRPSASHTKEAVLMAHGIFTAGITNIPVEADWTEKVGNIFLRRYERTTAREDLEEAISTARDVVRWFPAGHGEYAHRLNALGDRLHTKSNIDGTMEDLVEAIRLSQDALASTPEDRADRANSFSKLSRRLHARYLLTGDMTDLENAITTARNALAKTQEGDPVYVEHLDLLGAWLSSRYSHIQMLVDLEEAVQMAWLALKKSHENDPSYGSRLSTLGDQLAKRYLRNREPVDLITAICLAREALRLAPHYHPDNPERLDALGERLLSQYRITRKLADLYEAIELGWDAVKATPEDHPDIARRWNHVGVLYRHMYFSTNMTRDLDEALECTEEGLQRTPEDHPSRAARLMNLSTLLMDKHKVLSKLADLQTAKQCLNLALSHDSSPIAQRLAAGRLLLSVLDVHNQCTEAYLIAKKTIELVPLLFLPSLSNHDREHLLPEIEGLASDAAAIALIDGQDCFNAVTILELGRGLLHGSLYDLRSDLDELRLEHPELAESLANVRLQLENSQRQRSMVAEEVVPWYGSDNRHEASRQMAHLIEQIRKQPRFDRFMLPPSQQEILDVSFKGPVVIINVSSYRCDAFAITPSGIEHLELPKLSLSVLATKDTRSYNTLEWMWGSFIEDILDKLGFCGVPVANTWPHVWWIPTRPLVNFPLHAAGYHLSRQIDMTALDRVTSSYSSSIKSMRHGRKQRNTTQLLHQSRVVLVAMQHTSEARELKYAEDEISVVEDICSSVVGGCVRPNPIHKDVSATMETCTIFHFAGHGNSRVESPLESLLLLKDWKDKPFTVGDVMDMRTGAHQRILAYLSACGTGQIQKSAAMDESIHLVGAFQLAGFRNVVGALWEVDDELCVSMASLFYGFIQENGLCDESVSGGLAFASRSLRDKWVRGQIDGWHGMIRDNVRTIGTADDDGEVTPPLWVPYIHFGV